MTAPILATLAAALSLAAAVPAGAAPDPLAAHRDRDRVLVVSALDPSDAALQRQRDAFRAMAAGARERDLVLLEAVGLSARAAAIRRSAGIDTDAFAAVLVGKDGGPKLRSATVLGPDQLFPTIDAMPMRQGEMRQGEMRRRR